MQEPSIRIKTSNFRAINDADIAINGITLVAGENGSGKSTISKLLYYVFQSSNNINTIVRKRLSSSMKDLVRFFELILQDLMSNSDNYPINTPVRNEINFLRRELSNLANTNKFFNKPSRIFYLEEEFDKWRDFIRKVEKVYLITVNSGLFKDTDFNEGWNSRIRHLLLQLAKRDNIDIENIKSDNYFDTTIDILSLKFNKAIFESNSRPKQLVFDEILKNFPGSKEPTILEAFELESIIFSLNRNSVGLTFNIQNVIYIDTPMMIGVESENNQHWNDLNFYLSKEKDNWRSNEISEIINDKVISGEVLTDEESYSSSIFSFKRSDGEIFDLLNVATGIKSFSILNILLSNGSLTDKTLLIIDEPESHLHPQWIIEYARIIVLLNKHIGVKFFLASHNPDFVSAIRYISEKEGILKDINFYLTYPNGNYKYDFRHLDKEIDPIFASFNIGLERINQYGI